MAEIKISEIQNELLTPDPADRLEIADMDGNSGNPQTKYIEVENLQGDSIDFFDSGATYDAGDFVLRSANATDDGTYDGNQDDWRLYVCQVDNTSGSWGSVSSDFQEVVFVVTDDSLTGDGYPGSQLSVDVTGIDYNNNEDGLTIDTVADALNFLMASNDFYIVESDNERSNLNKEEGRLIFNRDSTATTPSPSFQKYLNGNWKDLTLIETSKTGRINNTGNTTGIISQSEANRLQPDTKIITSADLSTVTFDSTTYEEYTLASSDFGKVIKFDGSGLSNPILIKLPLSNTADYPVGWHTFIIEYTTSTKIHLAAADPGDTTPSTSNDLNPFSEVDLIAGYMGTVYNIRQSGDSDNLWSAIGNIIDGT